MLGSPPAIGHEVPRDPKDVAPQILVAKRADVGAKKPAEGVLHDIVRVPRVTCDAIHVGPQRPRRALVEPREFELVQSRTYTERATSFEAGWCEVPLMSPIRRDNISDT